MFNKKNKIIVKVLGMSCEHCSKKVENALISIDGITKIKVDLKKQEVTILSNHKIDNNVIIDKINSLEYQVSDIISS